MIRMTESKKLLAIVLAMLIFLSGLSLVTVSAADIFTEGTGTYTTVQPIGATMDEAPLGAGAESTGYKITYDSKDEVVWTKYTEFTSPVDGQWGAFGPDCPISFKRAINPATNEKVTVTCIQPNVGIGDAPYSKSEQNAFYKKLKNNKNMYNALAKLKALARKMGSDSKSAAYYAESIMTWQYLTGLRNPTSHKVTNSGYKKISQFIKAKSSSLLTQISSCYTKLEKLLEADYTSFPYFKKADKDNFGFYKTQTAAKDGVMTELEESKTQKGTYIRATDYPIANLDKYPDITLGVYTAEGAKKNTITVKKLSNRKLEISTKEKLEKDRVFFIKATRTVPVVRSEASIALNGSNQSSQALIGPLMYNEPDKEGYLAFKYKPEDPGEIRVKKKIVVASGDEDYEPDVSGWWFLFTNKSNTSESPIKMKTAENGYTNSPKRYNLGTKVEITELGKAIKAGQEDEFDLTTKKTVDGVDFAMPKFYTNRTGTKTITISQENQTETIEWVNKCDVEKGGIKVVKDVELYNEGLEDDPETEIDEREFTDEDQIAELMNDVDLSGWAFVAYDETAGREYVLITNENGVTNEVKDIPVGHKFVINEIGRAVPEGKESDFKPGTIDTYEGVKYGIPLNTTVKTKDRTVYIAPDTMKRVHMHNGIPVPAKVSITKTCDDGETAAGYYFLVYDKRTVSESKPEEIKNMLINDFRIVGPTDESGVVTFNLDNNAPKKELVVVELGLKTDNTYTKTKLTKQEFISKDYNGKFEIPEQYDKVSDSGTGALYSLGHVDARSFKVTADELIDLHKDIIIENTTSGYIKVIKKDSKTHEPVANATYGVFKYLVSPDNADANNNDISLDDIEVIKEGEGENETELSSVENLVCTIKTNENGEAVTPKLRTGKYYIQELESPDNYVLDKEQYPLELTKGHKTKEMALELNVEDKPSEVIINKYVAGTRDRLKGAEIQIFEKSEGKDIDYTSEPFKSFISGEEAESFVGEFKVGKTYVIHEAKPPKGYKTADDIEFTVSKETGKAEKDMEDEPTDVEISKKDITGKEEVIGASLTLEDEQGNVIDTWTSEKEPHKITAVLEINKKYKLIEKIPAPNYASATDIEFIVEDNKNIKVQKVTMKDAPIQVYFYKTNITGTKEIEGAQICIEDKDGNVLETWVSGKTAHRITCTLEAGKKYVFKEKVPAPGYVTAKAVNFTVKDTGKVQSVYMKDAPTKVLISKTNITGSTEIKGATLEIKDKNGKTVDKWVSGETPHLIEGVLIVNETYTLTETIPAPGYATANSKVFTVLDTNKVQGVVMKDDTTKYDFSKTDITGGKEIPGATLVITDEDGTVIDKWVSGKKPHKIEGKLIVNKKYIMTETIPAPGYATANSIVFTVKDTGKLRHVVMKDDTIKVEIVKIDGKTGKPLAGATLQLYDTVDKKVVEEFVSTDKPYRITKPIIANREYELREIKAPKGFELAGAVRFKALDTGRVQTVKMVDVPKTGGHSSPVSSLLLALGIILMLSGACVFLVSRRRYNN